VRAAFSKTHPCAHGILNKETRNTGENPVHGFMDSLLKPKRYALPARGNFRAGRRELPLPKSVWDGRPGQMAFEFVTEK
jgi:hypothetical protein